MFYREAGQFKTSYAADQGLLPIPLDRAFIFVVLIFAFVVLPFIGSDYWLGTIIIPVLIMSIAALGLNILTGYAGQLSLGTGGFMAAGAYMAFKIAPSDTLGWLPIPIVVLLGGTYGASRLGAVFIPRLSEEALVINTVRLAGVSVDESVRYGTQL